MDTFIVVLIFVAFATALLTVGAAFFIPASVVGTRLQALLGRSATQEEKPTLQDRMEQVLEPISKALPKSPSELSDTRLWLMRAGYRDPRHMQIYFGLRGFAAIATLVLALLTGLAGRSILLVFVLPVLAYQLPRFILKRMIRSRQERIQLALPDGLDLAIVCVEAGLGLDQAIDRVGVELKHAHRDLSDELRLVILEMRAGKGRADALRNLASRTAVDDVKKLVAVLVQTERFGTSVANALRVHSDSLRTQRRQRAEERAAKTTIKMIPVLVLFVFPVMFFVILGPVVISIMRELAPVLQK
jgi:tight adherence protein C